MTWQYKYKPPLNTFRIIGQYIAGFLAGWEGGSAGLRTAEYVWPPTGSDGDLGLPLLYGPCVFLAFLLTCPLGVYLVGRIGKQSGSFWATLGGTLIFAAFAVAIALIIPEEVGKVGPITLAAIPPIGAVIGCNLTRKERPDPDHPDSL